jgi:transposase
VTAVVRGSSCGPCSPWPAVTYPERQLIRTRLEAFYLAAAASTAPEAHRLAGTVEVWWPAIEAAIVTGYSNARSEGYTNWPSTKDA